MSAPIAQQVEALERLAELATPTFPVGATDGAVEVAAKVRDRMRHGTDNTVVAIAGPTGAGKSSLFNALAGTELSNTGVRRPTTSATHAVTFAEHDASGLLDWLEVKHRHVASTEHRPSVEGLVLLDLPDHDSVAVAHRVEVDRLVELVDVLIWVTDPEKYADQALHEGYIRPLARYGDVMAFALTKVDLLSETDLAACVGDFEAKLTADGIVGPRVVAISTVAAPGIEPVWQLLESEHAEREAMVLRLEADVAEAASAFATVGPDRAEVEGEDRHRLASDLADAAGLDRTAAAIERQHVVDGVLACGWPVTRWIRRMRRQPIRDVPMASDSAVATSAVDVALRNFAESTADGLTGPWPRALSDAALATAPDTLVQLGRVTTRTAASARNKPGWWTPYGAVQKLASTVALVGLVWLLAVAIGAGFFQLSADPLLPLINDWLPIPTAMVGAGVLVGLVLALIAKWINAVGARRRRRAVEKDLVAAVDEVAASGVVAPVEAVLGTRTAIGEALAELGHSPAVI